MADIRKTYEKEKRREIVFPLGGIGAGSIGLDGTGRLRDWEIRNHPAKGSLNGYSHFGIKAEERGKTPAARVLQTDFQGSLMGRYVEDGRYQGYGYGPERGLMCGVPHFEDAVFRGEFPFAQIDFLSRDFPGKVRLEAFSPFIPSDEKDSSLPAAFFTVCVENDTEKEIDYTVECSVGNMAQSGAVNRQVRGEGFHALLLEGGEKEEPAEEGSLLLGVPSGDESRVQQAWYRGSWFDDLGIFWRDFTASGPLRERSYAAPREQGGDMGTVAVRFTLRKGERRRQRFLIAWYYPNCRAYWKKNEENRGTWKNWYATVFSSAQDVAAYCFSGWDALEEKTRRFHDALFASDLPPAVMDAVSANLAVLKSPTVLRLEGGEFYGFEGCQCNVGSCEGSCTHVWNYAMALPFLFPKLERSMRELDYTYNQREDGGMPFRLQLPLGAPRSAFRSCVDGQMGGILKMYREWKLCGDDAWLRRWWPKVKKALEYAWAPTNEDLWDPSASGVITGRQHHTLDMELFGPNAWLNTFYAAALTAAAEMARAMGEEEDAGKYLRMAENGIRYIDTELFNGEYYIQKIDLRDPDVLRPYEDSGTLVGGSVRDRYWNGEEGQIKYQIGEGCGIDQVLGEWMSEMAGLGKILDPDHVRSALSALYRHNFKPDLREHFNPCRIFGADGEAATVICEWPQGKEKPAVPIPYAEECMTGFEYQAACHMILTGLEKEGLRMVEAIRARYDGERRNPWNEIECGSNYARSMASWGLLPAYSGFRFDMRKKRLGFLPLHAGRYFFSADGCWGDFSYDGHGAEMRVLYGEMKLREWVIPDAQNASKITLNDTASAFAAKDGAVCLNAELTLREGDRIRAEYAETGERDQAIGNRQ